MIFIRSGLTGLMLVALAGPVEATVARCAGAAGEPVFTDRPLHPGQCEAVVLPEPFPRTQAQAQAMPPAYTYTRSARTRQEIRDARAANQALRTRYERKERQCARAQARATAARLIPLRRKVELNKRAFLACR